jgi:hypothetical protein
MIKPVSNKKYLSVSRGIDIDALRSSSAILAVPDAL